jgi:hypothetical protein
VTTRLLAPAITLVAASAAVASVTHAHHAAQPGPPELVASVKKRVAIKGVPVTGLYPGATRPLTVKVTNSYPFAITVAPLTTRVRSTNRQGCTGAATNLVVVPAGARSLPIRPHKSKSVLLQVSMPSTVANACQGATFSLSFSARATRA